MATARFIHYEIWPVCEDGQTGMVEICPTWSFASQMAFRTHGRPFWRLFGRCHSGSEISIGDYFSFLAAANVYQLITGRVAPAQEGAYHRLCGGDAGAPREDATPATPSRSLSTVQSAHGAQRTTL